MNPWRAWDTRISTGSPAHSPLSANRTILMSSTSSVVSNLSHRITVLTRGVCLRKRLRTVSENEDVRQAYMARNA